MLKLKNFFKEYYALWLTFDKFLFQLGSFDGDDEAELDSEPGRLAHDPRFNPDVGYVQSRERQGKLCADNEAGYPRNSSSGWYWCVLCHCIDHDGFQLDVGSLRVLRVERLQERGANIHKLRPEDKFWLFRAFGLRPYGQRPSMLKCLKKKKLDFS